MYQETIVIGYVGAEPEFEYLQSGVAVANFNVAVNETWTKDGKKHEDTTWFRCTTWRATAENVNKYVKKGMLVMCKGTVKARAYMPTSSDDDAPAEPRASLDLTVRTLKFLSRPAGSDSDDYDYDQRPQHEREQTEYPEWGDD